MNHFLDGHPEVTLSENKLKIIPRNDSEASAAHQRVEFALAQRQEEGKQTHLDKSRSQAQQAISAIVPAPLEAELSDDRRSSQIVSPFDGGPDKDIISVTTDSSTAPSGSNTSTQPIITREMPISEVLNLLSDHGCKNVTGELDVSNFSQYPISAGGYGDVYRGAFRDGSRVAVKCLRLHLDSTDESKKQLKRAAREMYVWSKCNHPNVLGLIGVAQYRDQIAMVSPWMEYGNIRRTLSLQPQVDRYELCVKIVEGVVYLHGVGIVHGDLKGDNVLVSSDFIPKVTDFGNAALKEYTLQFSNTTSRAGTSLNWVAPEVLGEETGPSVEADVYSLGMTILEIIAGKIPYAGLRDFVIVKNILSGVRPMRPEEQIPSNRRHADLLWSLLTSCWAHSAQGRPTPIEVLDKMKMVILEKEMGERSA